MKYAANRNKTTVKAKIKTLGQAKALGKTKPGAKKLDGKIVPDSRRKPPVQKIESAAVKSAPKNQPRRAAKLIAETTAPKFAAKTLNALETIAAARRDEAARAAVSKQKPQAKKAAPAAQIKAAKATKPIAAVKKAATGSETKKTVTAPRAKSKIAAAKPKFSVVPPAKTSIKTAKIKSSKVTAQTAKPQRQTKVEIDAATKIKSVGGKTKPIAAAKKSKNIEPSKPAIAAKSNRRGKNAPPTAAEKVNRKSEKIQPMGAAKKNFKKAEKIKPRVAAKTIVRKSAKINPAVAVEKAGGKILTSKRAARAAAVEKQNPKIKKTISVGGNKTIENVVETAPPRPQKPKNRKARPISSAVFRGKKERYDFKVFALNEKFEPIPAVYIISKRKTDKNKRGHHALICIGETASISDELKRHRKGKCVKKHEANAVSILPEADEKMRLKIETDLRAAHAVACNLN